MARASGKRSSDDPVFLGRLLPRRPQWLLTRIERPHDADARQHGVTIAPGDQDQCLDRREPLQSTELGLRQFGDEVAGIAQRAQLASAGERDRIGEGAVPTLFSHQAAWGVPDLTLGADIKPNTRLSLRHIGSRIACGTFQQALRKGVNAAPRYCV